MPSIPGSSMSKNLTVVEKFGLRLAFMITDDWIICPAHSINNEKIIEIGVKVDSIFMVN